MGDRKNLGSHGGASSALGFFRTFFLGLIAGVLSAGAGCSKGGIEEPSEILDRISLNYPSILGYVRIDPRRAERTLFDPEFPFPLAGEKVFPLLSTILPLCREGTYLTILLVDPVLFGGPAALYFQPDEGQNPVEELARVEGYRMVAGSNPPQLTWESGTGLKERMIGLAGAMGLDASFLHFGPLFRRAVLAEGAGGLFVLPSLDLKAGFERFLVESDGLKPWGGASLVVNLEFPRLIQAYKEEIAGLNRFLAEFQSKLGGLLESRGFEGSAMLRMAQAMPDFAEAWVRALKGLRFVSSTPWNGRPELCIDAAEGRFLDELFQGMRPDRPTLPGRVPGGIAFQWNFDPMVLAGLVNRGFEFFGQEVELDRDFLAAQKAEALRAMADDAGRYLFAITRIEGGISALFLSSLEEGAESAEKDHLSVGPSFLEALLGLLFAPESLEKLQSEERNGNLRRILFQPVRERSDLLPSLFLERWTANGVSIHSIRAAEGVRSESGVDVLDRLARMGGAPLRREGLPDQAELFIRLSLPPLGEEAVPGIESLLGIGIMGFGRFEEHRLKIEFLPP